MEKRKRILVVDSDEQFLIRLEQLLEGEGIGITIVSSAQQVLELLSCISFDILLMGDHLPDLSCEQLLREIQRQGGPASILVMESGSARVPSMSGYYDCLGVDGTIRKHDFGTVLRSINSFPRKRACAA